MNDLAMNGEEPLPSRSTLPSEHSLDGELREAKGALESRTEELTTSLSLLSAALESTADAIVILDLSGKVTYYNRKFAELWYFPHNLLEARGIQDLRVFAATQAKDFDAFLTIIDNHVREPEKKTFDVVELKDGRIFERYGFPQWVDGECVGVVVNFREVTQRERAEAALRLSEEKYRLLWATAGDAFVLFGRDNIILEANAAVETIFGYAPEEVIGQPLSLLQPERLREGHRRGLQRYLETGNRTLNWSAAEAIGLHRDGHEIPVEIAFNHLHLEGQDFFAGFIRDISERKQSQQSLARLAAIVDSSHDAIISKTLTGIITSWNQGAESLFGYSASEAVGLPMLRLIPPDHADEEPRLLSQLARGEKIDHFDTVRLRKDGQRLNVSITLSPVMSDDGQVIGISTIAHDITQRKQDEVERAELLASEQKARQQAEIANRAKDEFLATLSHELRTPLNSILGWSQLLTDTRLSEQQRVGGLEAIHRNAQLQARLVEEVLDVSRIITGKMQLELGPVDMSPIIESAVESVLPSAQAKNIRLQRVLDGSKQFVNGDANRLQQVMWNLLSNAIKFTPSGGRVEVRLEHTESYSEISVTDTGIGIPVEFLPYAFERFRQADQSTTRKHGGLGLGLALVRHLVEAHGGSVEAYSAGEGQGTTFTVKLPQSAEQR